jgi:hypothetical protein
VSDYPATAYAPSQAERTISKAMDVATNPESDQPALRILRSLFPKLAIELNLFQLVAMGQLHRDLFNHPSEFLCTSLRTFLKSGWLDDPVAFRSRMREWGIVISGSSALSFIDHDDRWAPNDLDLYCPSQYASALLEYLKHAEGYVSQENINQDHEQYKNPAPGTASNIQSVTKLRKLRLTEELCTRVEQLEAKTSSANSDDEHYYLDRAELEAIRKDGTVSIDVVVSKTQCSLDPIFDFHSTVVMNFISADEVVSLYPVFTQARQSIIQNDRGGDKMNAALSKYASRKYSTFRSRLHLLRGQKCGALCPSIQSRRTDDRRCLRIPILREPGSTSTSPRYWEESEWRFEDKLPAIPPCWNQWCPNNLLLKLDEQVLTRPVIHLGVATYQQMCRFIQRGLEAMRMEHFLREASDIVCLMANQVDQIAKLTNHLSYYKYALVRQFPQRFLERARDGSLEKSLERRQEDFDERMSTYMNLADRLQLRSKAFFNTIGVESRRGDEDYQWSHHLETANRVHDAAESLQTAIETSSSDAIPGILEGGLCALDDIHKRQLYGFIITGLISKELLDTHVQHWNLECRINRLTRHKARKRDNFQYEEQLTEDTRKFQQLEENLAKLQLGIQILDALVWRPDYEVEAPRYGEYAEEELVLPEADPSICNTLLRLAEIPPVPVYLEETVDGL